MFLGTHFPSAVKADTEHKTSRGGCVQGRAGGAVLEGTQACSVLSRLRTWRSVSKPGRSSVAAFEAAERPSK